MRTHYLDPFDPSSHAWELFDDAIEAYRMVPVGSRNGGNFNYKRYTNCRYRLVQFLRKEGASETCINEWLDSLQQQCKLPRTHQPKLLTKEMITEEVVHLWKNSHPEGE